MKIIDCFPYNGESIALFRLAYLWDVVDEFVIVEAGETHTGQRKAGLFLDKHAPALEPFARKITRLVIDRFPTPTHDELAPLVSPRNANPSAWFREKYQRNFAADYLRGRGEPWILLGCDVDEIPRRETVLTLPGLYDGLTAGYRLQMDLFYYSSRWIKRDKWLHAFVANDRAVRHESLDGLRTGRSIQKGLRDAGWHLSYFMSDEEIQRKLQAFAHTELSSEESRKLAWIQQCRRTGQDLHRRGPHEDCLPYAGDDLPDGLRAFEILHGISTL